MAYPTVDYMRNLLPSRGQGITDPMIESALTVAIAQVVSVTDDPEGLEPLGVAAAEKYAHADLLEKILPRDARGGRTAAGGHRGAGDALLVSFEKMQAKDEPKPEDRNNRLVVERAPWAT